MALYKLFSHSVEIQYKSYFLSKATLFTILIAIFNLTLPFIVAFNSKGFWLQSHYFFEQPSIRSTYDYLLIAETDDPSINIICGEAAVLNSETIEHEENCVETQTTCPLQMQSLAIINKEFAVHPNGLKYYGDIQIYQTVHLPCFQNMVDTTYNSSIFSYKSGYKNTVDSILEEYLSRDVITTVTPIFSRNQNGLTGTMDLNIVLKISEIQIRYLPSLLQELKWAWPQYLSLLFIFYCFFNRIKRFVFSKRLLMAWKIVPWSKNN
nr:transmembrane protein 231 isoform X2 [Vanessa tameamea]